MVGLLAVTDSGRSGGRYAYAFYSTEKSGDILVYEQLDRRHELQARSLQP